jgi:hypothetical protein
MTFIKVMKYDSYTNKLDLCYINRNDIHLIRNTRDTVASVKELVKLGITGNFELIDLVYNTQDPIDTIIVSSVEDFLHSLER